MHALKKGTAVRLSHDIDVRESVWGLEEFVAGKVYHGGVRYLAGMEGAVLGPAAIKGFVRVSLWLPGEKPWRGRSPGS